MSVNIKRNGTLQKLADQTLIFDANVSEVRTGTYSIECMSDSGANATITFSTPMPDTDYIVIFKQDAPAAGEIGFRACTTTGFNLFVLGGRFGTAAEVMTFTGTYYAFKLIELEGYTALYNKINNSIDSQPTQNSTNFITSGGVYNSLNPTITDLKTSETVLTYDDWTVNTLGAHMTRIGNMCWVHIDYQIYYTGETLDTTGHTDFWSNAYSIPDFDDPSNWNAIPGFGYISNDCRRLEITLNNHNSPGPSITPRPQNQKIISFRIGYSEDQPITTNSTFNLRTIFYFVATN